MKKRAGLFTTILILAILTLSVLSARFTSTVTIQGEETRQMLVNALASQLEAVSIVRARSIVPGCDWLVLDEQTTPEVAQYIEENVGNSFRSAAESMTRDSNLAWIIRCNGKEYRHNWVDSYSQEEGALNYTIRSNGGKITYAGATQPNVLFSRAQSILVNPAIVPEERRNQYGSEYYYSLTLPDGFSIEYYVPKTLAPNGGSIVRTAAVVSQRGIDYCMSVGSVIILLLVFLYSWKGEEDFPLLKRISRLKAIFAAAVLLFVMMAIFSFTANVTMSSADGSLKSIYQSFSMTSWWAGLAAYLSVITVWAAFFFSVALLCLYIKRAVKKGPAFIEEDLASTWLIRRLKKRVNSILEPDNRKAPETKMILCAVITLAILAILMCTGFFIGQEIFGYPIAGLMVGTLAGITVCLILIFSVGHKSMNSYHKVYLASRQLAKGDFSSVQPQSVGIYQPLYNEMLHVSDRYESALKEGLSSQVTKAQLISNVSHDLKTPVAGIQSYSELISLSSNMDDIRHYAAHLQNYTARLNALMEDLFDITKATSGDIALDLTCIDLCELVEQVKVEWEDSMARKNLTIVSSLYGPVMIEVDPDKTVRVIDNILSNALKYSLEGTRVFIGLERFEKHCELRIRNTSATILDFDPEKIMERFVRGDASRSVSGSGLGLAIVKSFVEVMDGTFEIKVDGDLFTAILRFPIDPEKQPEHVTLHLSDNARPQIEKASEPAENPIVHSLRTDPPAFSVGSPIVYDGDEEELFDDEESQVTKELPFGPSPAGNADEGNPQNPQSPQDAGSALHLELDAASVTGETRDEVSSAWFSSDPLFIASQKSIENPASDQEADITDPLLAASIRSLEAEQQNARDEEDESVEPLAAEKTEESAFDADQADSDAEVQTADGEEAIDPLLAASMKSLQVEAEARQNASSAEESALEAEEDHSTDSGECTE